MKKFAALMVIIVAVTFSAGLVISAEAPGKVTIKHIQKTKEPVVFDHKAHATTRTRRARSRDASSATRPRRKARSSSSKRPITGRARTATRRTPARRLRPRATGATRNNGGVFAIRAGEGAGAPLRFLFPESLPADACIIII